MKRSINILLAFSVIAGMLAVAGCGGGSSSNTTSPSAATPPTTSSNSAAPTSSGTITNLKISADAGGSLAFDKSTLSAKTGDVTITMSNPSSIPHAIAIEGNGVDKTGTGGTSGVPQGQSSTVSANLKPGTYTFYCPVDGHKASGMKGTLTVK